MALTEKNAGNTLYELYEGFSKLLNKVQELFIESIFERSRFPCGGHFIFKPGLNHIMTKLFR